jgi:hypothetical protein
MLTLKGKAANARMQNSNKAKLLQEGIFFFIHLFARDVLVMKKFEIEKK